MKNNAYDYQTVKYTHPRLPVDLGNLSGPEGNAFMVSAKCSGYLKARHYKTEYHELSNILFYVLPNYDASFNKIAFYLDLAPEPQPIDLNSMAASMMESANGEEVIFKINKKDLLDREEEIYQYDNNRNLENYWKPKAIEKLLKQAEIHIEEVMETNNLGRNVLFYIRDVEEFKLIEQRLIDNGTTESELEAWISQPDVGNTRAVDTFFLGIDSGIVPLADKTKLMLYLVSKYPNAFDLSQTNTFGLNTLTGLLWAGKGFKNQVKEKLENNDTLVMVALFQELSKRVKTLPGYKKALELNENIPSLGALKKIKNKDKEIEIENTFILGCSDIEDYMKNNMRHSYDNTKNKEAYNQFLRVKIELEKMLLDTTIHSAQTNEEKRKSLKI